MPFSIATISMWLVFIFYYFKCGTGLSICIACGVAETLAMVLPYTLNATDAPARAEEALKPGGPAAQMQ